MLLVPPLVVHGFQFEPRLQGHVVTVLAQHMSKVLTEEPALERRLSLPGVQQLDTAQAAHMSAAFRALRDEYRSAGDWRSLGVDGALTRLLVTLGRSLPMQQQPSASSARGLQHVRRYRALIEESFRQQPAVSALAAEIGITSTHLNRVC